MPVIQYMKNKRKRRMGWRDCPLTISPLFDWLHSGFTTALCSTHHLSDGDQMYSNVFDCERIKGWVSRLGSRFKKPPGQCFPPQLSRAGWVAGQSGACPSTSAWGHQKAPSCTISALPPSQTRRSVSWWVSATRVLLDFFVSSIYWNPVLFILSEKYIFRIV